MPRDLIDLALTLIVCPVQLGFLFVLPSYLVFLITNSRQFALLLFFVVYLIFLLFSVWGLGLSSEGIRFKRLLGSPKFVPWQDILSIEEAPRWELIRKGWLWPLFPAREMTASLSSIGHYRISWHDGFCYFPPADNLYFEHYVSQYQSQRNA